MTIKILLVDDHKVFRMGLNLLIAEEPDMEVVGEAGDGQTAITQVQALTPDVVIMDISMPDMDGIEATHQIKAEFPQTQIICLSIHAEKDFVENMLRAGATGYVLKENALEELVASIRAIEQGEIFLSATIKDVVITQYVNALDESKFSIDTIEQIPLLTTKLHRPALTTDSVVREHLLQRLNQGRQRPFTLVSAPAGYGKTTLVSSWLETVDDPSAWYQLDDTDNDLAQFLTYFIAAVQTIDPTACQKTKQLLQAPTLPPLPVLVASLVSELEQIQFPFVLVIDDYHLIHTPTIHAFIDQLLAYPIPGLHLIISTRQDPPLPLAKLRAQGLLSEIRRYLLSFSAEETAVFLQNVIDNKDNKIDEELVSQIAKKTEGWATAIRLMALSLQGHGDSNRLLAELPENIFYITEYLTNEVLANQPPEIRDFLLKTAVLNRFSRPLCQALCGSDEQDVLTQLRQQNLFIISLDHQNEWFRYHHLFQDLLQNQLQKTLSTAEITDLHAKASRWFAENDLIDEALDHAILAQDITYAEHLIEQYRYDLMNREQWRRLARWLNKVPSEIVQKNPSLVSTQAYLYDFKGQIAEAYSCRDQVEALLLTLPLEFPNRKVLQGEIAVLRAQQYLTTEEAHLALECSEMALEVLPANARHIRSYAIGSQAVAHQMAGNMNVGVAIINRVLNKRSVLTPITEARMMLWFCLVYWMEGDPNGVKTSAHRCLKIGVQYQLSESHAFGRFFLGAAHYVRNELTEAERYLTELVNSPFAARPRYLRQAAFLLVRIHLADGREEKAANVIAFMVSRYEQTNNTLGLMIIRTFQVELALVQGNVSEAQRLNEGTIYDSTPLVWFPYVAQLTPIKLLLAQNTTQSLELAIDELDKLYEFVYKMNRKTILIDVLALKSLILDAQGKEPAALQALTESLILAERGGFIRNYTDLGSPMADLLLRLQAQGQKQPFIGKILDAFPSAVEVPYKAVSKPSQLGVGNHLTKREKQVLRLLTTDLTTEEIASNLSLSVATVRTHTKRIYSKLNVHTRIEAVFVSREKKIF